MNPLATALNEQIKNASPVAFEALSKKGRNIFFPTKGILAQTAEAKGKAINATIGAAIEDDGTPMRLPTLDKLVDLDPVRIFPYAPSFGRPDLRVKWQEMIQDKNPSLSQAAISLPVATNALTHGLSMAAYLFCDPGEAMLIPDLYWGNYNLIFKLGYEVKFLTYPLFSDKGFNVQGFQQKIKDSKAAVTKLLLNFPNNPTGYSLTDAEYEAVIDCLLVAAKSGKKLLVLCDDAYFGLIYEDGVARESLFARLAGLHENLLAVKIDGPTKEDFVWGFRTGFMTFGTKGGTRALYESLEAKLAGAVRGTISNAANISQSLLLDAYTSSSYKAEKQSKYITLQARYEAVKKTLNDHPEYAKYFKPLPFNSGYFMCVKLADGLDGEAVRQKLLTEYDTGIIYAAGVIRVAFSAVAEKQVSVLFDNLYQACNDLR